MNILIDADDTLWHCSRYYYAAIEQFKKLLKDNFTFEITNVEDVITAFNSMELKRVTYRGKNIERFTESMLFTYMALVGQRDEDFKPEVEEEIRSFSSLPNKIIPELYPNVIEALEEMYKLNHLILYTESNPELTMWKLGVTGLRKYFGKIHVVPVKNKQVLESFAADYRIDWIIGNSPTSDIAPANELDIKTILIPQGQWAHDTLVDATPTFVCTDLMKAWEKINAYLP